MKYLFLYSSSGSEADDSSDDELPEIKLTVPDVSNKATSEKSEAKLPAELLGDPHQTFGSLVNKTGERKGTKLSVQSREALGSTPAGLRFLLLHP